MIPSNISTLALLGTITLSYPSLASAEGPSWGERLRAARGAEYQALRQALLEEPAEARAQLRAEAEALGPDQFERAGLLLGALAWAEGSETCRARVYDLRGLDAERAAQRRRKDPEAASHLRLAVRNGCGPFVLELALRPELYELEVARSLAPEQRAALERGLVIALGGAKSPAVVGYLGSRVEDSKASIWVRRRALEAFGRVAGSAGTHRLRAIADDPRQLAEIRAGALVGLGFGGDPAALPSLEAALRAPEPSIAAAALVGISSLAGPEQASGALRAQVSQVLVSRLAEPGLEDARGVIDALAYVAHPSAAEGLRRLRGAAPADRLDAAERRVRRALARAGGAGKVPGLAPVTPEAAGRR